MGAGRGGMNESKVTFGNILLGNTFKSNTDKLEKTSEKISTINHIFQKKCTHCSFIQ